MIRENIRDLRVELRTAEFQTDANYWKSCISAGSISAANTCQEEAYRRSSSKSPQFAPFYNNWEDGQGSIFDNEDKFRKAEVNLVTFRNYGQLNIMILLTLINTFEPTPEENEGENQERFDHYRRELYTWIDFCHGYLQWSVVQVTKAYHAFSYKAVCTHDNDITNFLGFVFSKEYTCSARMGYNYAKSSECVFKVSENRLVQLPSGYVDCCGGEKIGKKKLQAKFDTSYEKEKASILNYMASQFSSVLAKWKEIQAGKGKSSANASSKKTTSTRKGRRKGANKKKVKSIRRTS